ncbi:MAG: hypothetical protein ACOCZM_01270 [Bacillota bacterium]
MLPSEEEFNRVVELVEKNYDYSILRLQKYLADIQDKIYNLVDSSGGESQVSFSGGNEGIYIFLGAILFIIIVGLVFAFITRNFRREGRVKEILGEKIEEDATSVSYREKARTFREEGRYRQAVRCEFISLLLFMEEKNIIYHNENRTNREILQTLRQKSFSGMRAFRELMVMFNYTWYGNRSCTMEMYEHWREEIEVVRGEVVNYEK